MSSIPPARRRLSPYLVLALSLLPVAVVMALLSLRPRPSNDRAPAAAEARSGDLSGEVAQMRGELKLLRRQLQVMSQQQGKPGALLAASAAAAHPPAKPPSQEEASARDRRRFEGLARKLAAEPVDASWAPATQRLIADTLKKPAFKGSRLLEATCHSTLCRFEVSHDSESDRLRFSSTLPNRLPSLPSGSMRNAEGNERKTIVYVAREGHQVPRDEPQ